LAERVYTYVDFFDRPLSGAADFEGRPHWHKCEFNEAADEYEEAYQLAPLPNDILAAAVERQTIFLAWHAAYKAGQTDRSTHPALPDQRARCDELSSIVGGFVKDADFRINAKAMWSHQKNDVCVDWRKLDG
jgi:hypothetical protein